MASASSQAAMPTLTEGEVDDLITIIKYLGKELSKRGDPCNAFMPLSASCWKTAPLPVQKLIMQPGKRKNLTEKEIANNIHGLNSKLAKMYGELCEKKQLVKDGNTMNVFNVSKEGLHLAKAWAKAWAKHIADAQHSRQDASLVKMLTSDEGVPEDLPQEMQWWWGSLDTDDPKVNLYVTPHCLKRAKEYIPNDPDFFPTNDSFLRHYFKIHLRHRLIENKRRKNGSDFIAWYGTYNDDAEEPVPEPEAILFNTQLPCEAARDNSILLLCAKSDQEVVDENPNWFNTPWVAVDVVLSSELSQRHPRGLQFYLWTRVFEKGKRRRSRIGQGQDARAVPDRNAITNARLVDKEGKPRVPADMLCTLDRSLMTFDSSAFPHRVFLPNIGRHIRRRHQEETRAPNHLRGRIPQAFVHLEDDELRDRAMWAVERAAKCPNIALVQWFVDKKAEVGSMQLILPMTLEPPPASLRTACLGLVLDINIDDNTGDVHYSAHTALPLGVIFNNVAVCFPYGGHWLSNDLVKAVEGQQAAGTQQNDGQDSEIDSEPEYDPDRPESPEPESSGS